MSLTFSLVAGGKCDLLLGNSYLTIGILGCKWRKNLSVQRQVEQAHNGVPAAILEVEISQITEKKGGEEIILQHITESFRNPLVIRTIDLRTTGIAKEQLNQIENGTFQSNTGTESNINQSKKVVVEEKDDEKVRFQFDGTLILTVDVEKDEKRSCGIPTDVDANSFHVLPYMTLFKTTVSLNYEIKKGVFCDAVEENYKLSVVSDVGLDKNLGFEQFYEGLDENDKDFLAACSNVAPPGGKAFGPCLFNITHDDEGGNAQAEVFLVTGRPNPVGTHTRNVFISVTGGTETPQHKAAFFISGLFSKGGGNSFALPTHQPIMILRDPP